MCDKKLKFILSFHSFFRAMISIPLIFTLVFVEVVNILLYLKINFLLHSYSRVNLQHTFDLNQVVYIALP